MNEEEQLAIESGKPVMIFHINSVGQMNPSATTVTNNYYGDQFAPEPDNAAQETDTNSKKKRITKGSKVIPSSLPMPLTLMCIKKSVRKPLFCSIMPLWAKSGLKVTRP